MEATTMDATAMMAILAHPFHFVLAVVVLFHAVRPLFSVKTRVIQLRALGASA
jgi:hypothetical protein